MTVARTIRSVGGSRWGWTAGLMVLVGCFSGLIISSDAHGQKPKTAPPKTTPAAPPKKEAVPSGRRSVAEAEAAMNSPQVAEINKQIEKGWKDNKVGEKGDIAIKPSDRCTDFEFIRRASLDIIGRIATVDEINAFMRDPVATRRAMLIERLLDSDEYAENWANIWSVWLMTRTGPSDRTGRQTYREQMQLWLEEQFSKKGHGWDKIVHDLITASGDTNENGAVNFILAHLGEPTPPPKVNEEGRFSFVPVTSRTTRLFLGLQTQCTQCHDHPFNPQWKQKHFWGVNAFFRQVERQGNVMMRPNQRPDELPKLTLKENSNLNAANAVFYETRKAVVLSTRATFLDNKKYDPKADKGRRDQLAEFITSHEYFAKAYVNRMWGHFFGRGMTVNGKDVDDFGEHNGETHPELLEYLSKEFKNQGVYYDPRALVRWICNSKAYGLSCVANNTNDKPEAEPFFTRMLLKSMSPEQLFQSLWVSTYANPRAIVKRTTAERKDIRNRWMQQLTVNFGDDEGNETTFNGTVVQALLLMNGKEINDAINDKDGPVAAAMRISPKSVLDNLYLSTLNRPPTAKEVQGIGASMRPTPALLGEKNPAAPWQDLFWALLNSSEFILNH